MNGYNLLREWFNFTFENTGTVRPIHSAMYAYLVDLWNRLGQKEKFGLPTYNTMELMNISSYKTYKKCLDSLIEFGFVKMVQKSINQHQSNIVALVEKSKASTKALDKATTKASTKASTTIDKQGTIEQGTIEQEFLELFKSVSGKKRIKVIDDKTKRQLKTLLISYTMSDIETAIKNACADQYHIDTKLKYITPEFITRPDKFQKFVSIELEPEKPKQSLTHKEMWG